MTQRQIDRSVARATGERRHTIRARGFSLADPLMPAFDPEPLDDDRYLDWDDVADGRYDELAVH